MKNCVYNNIYKLTKRSVGALVDGKRNELIDKKN